MDGSRMLKRRHKPDDGFLLFGLRVWLWLGGSRKGSRLTNDAEAIPMNSYVLYDYEFL